jgi:predicted porin
MNKLTPSRATRSAMFAAGLLFAGAAQAIDYGPFSLTGFAKVEAARVSNYCEDCEVNPAEARDRYWADEMVQGKSYGAGNTHQTLFQPYLGVKFDLPQGFKIEGLLSQRWRDGKPNFDGFLYEKNIALSHVDYGSVRIGAMPTRSWSVADYPYGTNLGLSYAWGSSGAAYGLLTGAIRVTTRPLDVAEGNLVLEATYDDGKSGWEQNKPKFWEFYAQYYKGDLVIDAMIQDTQNGTPSAFAQGPFTGLTPFPADDAKLGSSSQGIAMIMARYQMDSNWEISGGLRANRWSGAWAVITTPPNTNTGTGLVDEARWNNMFNVNWGPGNADCPCQGYAATSVDLLAGLRYRTGPWTAYTGMIHLGAAATANPTDRGQSNSMTQNTLGLNYNFRNGFELYGTLGYVRYARKGLAPLSMPANSAFSGVDSRLDTSGSWVLVGANYVF